MNIKIAYPLIALLIVIISITLLKTLFNSEDDGPLKILFLGNSYTFNNDLPQQIKEMRLEKNRKLSIEIKALTPSGAKLKDHLDSSFTLNIIRDGNWDIIVIQGHSLEPLINPVGFVETAKDLVNELTKYGAEVFLFETWSREIGNSVYSETWSEQNPINMQKNINMKYREITEVSGVSMIPVGSKWQDIIIDRPDIDLYSTDGSHPTIIGSFLTACIIYQYILMKVLWNSIIIHKVLVVLLQSK